MIEVCHISKKYGNIDVLNDVSLTVRNGEVVSILGHSGSGKSTLINCIAGLVNCDSGSITFDGKSLKDKAAEAYNGVGMVFQEHNLFPHLTVLDNLMLAPVHVLGMSRQDAEKKAYEYLDMVGMWERANEYPGVLSMGQRQRIAIARSLMMNPEYLLLDEPTSSLDTVAEVEVAEVIRGLKKQNITIILVTHKVELAREISDRIIFMHNGSICEQGTPEQIIDYPQDRRTKAFMDYCMSLVYQINSQQYDHPELNARIEIFGRKYRLGQTDIHSVQLVVEELLNLLPLDNGLLLSIAKSAKSQALTVDAVLQDNGREYMSPEAASDELSYTIVSGMCEKISEYINEDGERNIHLELRHNDN